MSMMTTMTTGIFMMTGHNSPLPLYKLLVFRVFVGLYGVAVSSFFFGLHDRVLTSVVTPLFRTSYVILPFQRQSVHFLHIGLRVSLFVHALLILLVDTVALHDPSAIVFFARIQVICCCFEFVRFFRFSTSWALLCFFFEHKSLKARDVHDESTADFVALSASGPRR